MPETKIASSGPSMTNLQNIGILSPNPERLPMMRVGMLSLPPCKSSSNARPSMANATNAVAGYKF